MSFGFPQKCGVTSIEMALDKLKGEYFLFVVSVKARFFAKMLIVESSWEDFSVFLFFQC